MSNSTRNVVLVIVAVVGLSLALGAFVGCRLSPSWDHLSPGGFRRSTQKAP